MMGRGGGKAGEGEKVENGYQVGGVTFIFSKFLDEVFYPHTVNDSAILLCR